MPQAGYEIAIIGGGMVGASLALALRQALPEEARIAVLEAVDHDPDTYNWQPSYDGRSTALSARARDFFTGLGVWEHMSQAAEPIRDIHVSDRGHFGVTRLCAKDHNLPALGYVVDNSWLGQVLVEAVKAHSGIDWQAPVTVNSLETDSGITTLETDSKALGSVTAKLVVLADGGRSGLAKQLGLTSNVRFYDQTAIVASVTPARHHNNVAYERFTDQGPMALLPRVQGHCALVWTMPASLAEERMQLVDDDFLTELQDRFGFRLGQFKTVGKRHSYPLQLTQAREQVRPGLVVIGNAVHSLHPVAGQGFNLSLRDIEALTRVLAGKPENSRYGDLQLLLSYERERVDDQCQTAEFSDKVVKLFSNNSLLLSAVRNFGLAGLDTVKPARSWFARQAMGFGR